MSGNGEKRPVSAGTKVMLVMLVLVIAGSALVLSRLSSGASVDLNKLNRNLLDLGRAVKDDAGDAEPAAVKAPEKQNAVYPGKDGKMEGADDAAIRKAEMSETAGAAGTSSGGTVAAGTSSGGTVVAAGTSRRDGGCGNFLRRDGGCGNFLRRDGGCGDFFRRDRGCGRDFFRRDGGCGGAFLRRGRGCGRDFLGRNRCGGRKDGN